MVSRAAAHPRDRRPHADSSATDRPVPGGEQPLGVRCAQHHRPARRRPRPAAGPPRAPRRAGPARRPRPARHVGRRAGDGDEHVEVARRGPRLRRPSAAFTSESCVHKRYIGQRAEQLGPDGPSKAPSATSRPRRPADPDGMAGGGGRVSQRRRRAPPPPRSRRRPGSSPRGRRARTATWGWAGSASSRTISVPVRALVAQCRRRRSSPGTYSCSPTRSVPPSSTRSSAPTWPRRAPAGIARTGRTRGSTRT